MPEKFIRKARLGDVLAIHALIKKAAESTPVIPRSQAALYDTLRDFYVYDRGEGIEGCCALHIVWADLAEIKSLSVDPECQGGGVGKALVMACLAEARHLEVPKVFALTAVTGFFEKLGFAQIEKHELPHKVWADCINCPQFPDCDELAVRIDLG
jgi:amino-acid N-acetyltransferase